MCLSQSAPNIISNAVVSWLNLGLRAGDECPPLTGQHVVDLYSFFMHVRIPSRRKNGWNGAFFTVLPFAWSTVLSLL